MVDHNIEKNMDLKFARFLIEVGMDTILQREDGFYE